MRYFIAIIISLILFNPSPSFAQNIDQSSFFFSDPLNLTQKDTVGKNLEDTAALLVIRVLSSVMVLIGLLAFIMFVYAGVSWMLAAGNEQRVTGAKKVMLWAVIGLIVTFSSYALLKIVVDILVRSFQVQSEDSSKSISPEKDKAKEGEKEKK